ncbi:MAG: NAD(P)H-dependent oxidoreductase subunit E, partial [Rhodocyclaceae bacterium]|nr:NAD(P)H-dependent oxidoreductase subunit E [Rhodocyclaceae bacterium]
MSGAKSTCACAECAETTEADLIDRLDDVLKDLTSKPGGLIPALQTTQNLLGYLPEAALRKIAKLFNKPLSEVTGVVTFYSFFSTVPRGKHLVRVCLGTACYVRGGKDVLEALKKKLGIGVGETTADRLFSLDIGRCFGACGMAPVLMINDVVHQRVKPARIQELLNRVAAADEAP